MDALSLFADGVYRQVVEFAAAVTALGLVVMAIIQSAKDLLPVRRWFHDAFVRAWLAHKARGHAARGGIRPDAGVAFDDLVELATTGDAHALFDLPIEQLAAQVAAAASQSLDYPARHEDLVRCLAASADPRDLAAILGAAPEALSRDDAANAEIDARTRVMHQVQRSVDALQISAGYRWRWYLQLTAFALSAALTLTAVVAAGGDAPLTRRLVDALPLAFVGGFIAPVARDAIARLTKPPQALR